MISGWKSSIRRTARGHTASPGIAASHAAQKTLVSSLPSLSIVFLTNLIYPYRYVSLTLQDTRTPEHRQDHGHLALHEQELQALSASSSFVPSNASCASSTDVEMHAFGRLHNARVPITTTRSYAGVQLYMRPSATLNIP
jgi:hypothetical protein